MKKFTTLAISTGAAGMLAELAQKHQITRKKLAEKMIEFFYRTGHDPEDLKIEGSAGAIKKLDRRLVSFIRTQEKEKLQPMLDELTLVAQNLRQLMEEAPTKKQLQQIVDNQRALKTIVENAMNKPG
ncbi:MAG: hypothetical protein HC880_00340 [Bacteroidia bacterium]|nr:hypothetical protein [Bacteroidia bacterium]